MSVTEQLATCVVLIICVLLFIIGFFLDRWPWEK
jgi:hypothetical protein